MTFRCPDTTHMRPPEHGPLYVVGCGHVFEAEPDDENLIDCPNCGMWFPADDAEAIWRDHNNVRGLQEAM